MKSRKLTVIIVSLCMCVSVLSGCGSTAEKEQAQHATEAQTAAAEPDTSLEDGEYTVNVELEGGSGRASVDSEAKVKVTDGQAYATIVWSSTYYDYMLVDGKKYTNENEGGNSTFTFPIAGVPCTMDVVGDTTAMSQPHEIDYTLTFSFAKDVSFKELKQTGQVKLSYADQFQIDEYGNYKLITIVDNGRFLLIPKGVPVPADVPEDVTVLQQPLNHVYLVSSAVMDLICQVGGLSHVAYTALKEDDWYVQQAKDAMADGSLVYAGKYSAPDYEQLLQGGCTFAIENTMVTHNPEVKEKLEELGIRVMVERSSYEKHPLGRLEWIKLFGISCAGNCPGSFSIFCPLCCFPFSSFITFQLFSICIFVSAHSNFLPTFASLSVLAFCLHIICLPRFITSAAFATLPQLPPALKIPPSPN